MRKNYTCPCGNGTIAVLQHTETWLPPIHEKDIPFQTSDNTDDRFIDEIQQNQQVMCCPDCCQVYTYLPGIIPWKHPDVWVHKETGRKWNTKQQSFEVVYYLTA